MDFAFALKKLVSLFIEPLGFTLLLWVVGLLLIPLHRLRSRGAKGRAKSGKRALPATSLLCFVLGTLVLYACSTQFVSDALTRSLERKVVPLEERPDALSGDRPPSRIVVLAHGAIGGDVPALSRLPPVALARVVGGAELAERFPEAGLIFTGRPDETDAMRAVAEGLGIDAGRITEETESRDTRDHAVYLAPELSDRPFLLVTSATHMPRALGLFRGQGLDPVAAPVDYRAPRDAAFSLGLERLVPRGRFFHASDLALHEWVGLAWSRLRGQWAPIPMRPPAETPSEDLPPAETMTGSPVEE